MRDEALGAGFQGESVQTHQPRLIENRADIATGQGEGDGDTSFAAPGEDVVLALGDDVGGDAFEAA